MEILPDDASFEGTEQGVLLLSNPQNATLADNEGVFTIVEDCLFCDDFEDGVLSPDWTYVKQSWTESNGSLQGTPATRKATVVADPAFSAGCSVCAIEAAMQSAGGDGNRVWLFGWYADKKNTVELLMKEESDKWILKRRVNGKIVSKGKGLKEILPNVSYVARIVYNGSQLLVSIDGAPLIQVASGGAVTAGTVGFQVKGATASFEHILVTQ
jgi:hypothetical protein